MEKSLELREAYKKLVKLSGSYFLSKISPKITLIGHRARLFI